MEQCWRDVLQTVWELRGQDKTFRELLPSNVSLTTSGACCNQFIMGRSMVHRRPLHVWSQLLHMLAIQLACHLGEPDYEHLYEFNATDRVKCGPEVDIDFDSNSSFAREHQVGSNIPGGAGEHLSHVIFGHHPLISSYPTQEETCRNFLPLRPAPRAARCLRTEWRACSTSRWY